MADLTPNQKLTRKHREELILESMPAIEEAHRKGTMPYLNASKGSEPLPQSFAHDSKEGRVYRGVNAFCLSAVAAARGVPAQFATAYHLSKAGYDVPKEAQSVRILGQTDFGWKVKTDERGRPVVNKETGNQERDRFKLDEPKPERYQVFATADAVPKAPQSSKSKAPEPLPKPKAVASGRGDKLKEVMDLCTQLDIPVKEVNANFSRGTTDGIEVPTDIARKADKAREIVSCIPEALREMGRTPTSGKPWSWKDPLADALAAHELGAALGTGSVGMSLDDAQRQNIAKSLKSDPYRVTQLSLHASKVREYAMNDQARERMDTKRAERPARPSVTVPDRGATERDRAAEAPAF